MKKNPKRNKLIDIHTHIIPNVDDGAESFEESEEILKSMINDGVSDVILTPHFQSVAQTRDIDFQKSQYQKIKEIVENKNLNINIHLGHEIRYQESLNPNYKDLTLANSKYVLIEFSTRNYTDIFEVIYEIKLLGLIPVIAHVERYGYLNYDDMVDLRKKGALLQVNSSSITEKRGWFSSKRLVDRMVEDELIDIIASDIHGINYRYHSVRKAYDFLKGKVNDDYLEKICYYNPKKIIDNK